MMGWKPSWEQEEAAPTPAPAPPPAASGPLWKARFPPGAWPMVELHQQYWRADPAERDALATRADLSARERLRLYHLLCLDLFESPDGQAAFAAEGFSADTLPLSLLGAHAERLAQLHAALCAPDSPWAPRPVRAWRGPYQSADPDSPDLEGLFRNASLTHLGALEVFRLNAQHQPVAVDFQPTAELEMVVLGPPTLFRVSGLRYADGRSETVLLPQQYGLSWGSSSERDIDGSMTRFVCAVDGLAGSGIGVGQQDLQIGGSLLGLSGIGLLAFPSG